MWLLLKPVVVSGVIGGMLAGWFCLVGLPFAEGAGDRLLCWAVALSGPVFATGTGSVASNPALAVGWLGLPLVAARFARPNRPTAWVAVAGVVLWLLSGLLTVIVYS